VHRADRRPLVKRAAAESEGRVGGQLESKKFGAYSSASVAESSVSARQGTKTSASIDILTPTQLHLVHNSTLIASRSELIKQLYFNYNVIIAVCKL
jgi:hypothetical protein